MGNFISLKLGKFESLLTLGSYMYKIVDIEKLFNKGKWIGTISMGIKPFKIKWLLLTKPLFIFDYFQ